MNAQLHSYQQAEYTQSSARQQCLETHHNQPADDTALGWQLWHCLSSARIFATALVKFWVLLAVQITLPEQSPLTSSVTSALTLVTDPGSRPRRWAPFLDSASKRLLKSLSKLSEKGIATLQKYYSFGDATGSIWMMFCRSLNPWGWQLWIQLIMRDDSYSQRFFFKVLTEWRQWQYRRYTYSHRLYTATIIISASRRIRAYRCRLQGRYNYRSCTKNRWLYIHSILTLTSIRT